MTDQLYICNKAIKNDCKLNSPYCVHSIPHLGVGISCIIGQCVTTGEFTKCIEFNFDDMFTEKEFKI